jgi:uncharacterized protein YqfA (UPF0365 family)
MSQLTITCPSCNEIFSVDQTLQNHLKNKKQKYQEETKVKDKFLKERNLEKKLALKAQNESEAKVQALRLKVLEAESEI